MSRSARRTQRGGSDTARSAHAPGVVAPRLLDRRLIFVTGKGGVGKTTVAAALGQLGASAGKRVLVCDLEASGDLEQAYECPPLHYQPREVTEGLYVMAMDTEAALREYLRLNFKLPTLGKIGPLAQAFELISSAVPGIREILTVGKLCHEVRADNFDLVIADAPASGNIVGQLAAPLGINELVRVGGIREQTAWMRDILEDPARTSVWVVATPEEMPVTEAIELADRLAQETGVHLGAVIANRVLPELFSKSDEEVFDRLSGPEETSLFGELGKGAGSLESLSALVEATRLALRLRRSETAHLERLRAGIDAEVPIAYLPFLFGRAFGPRAIRQVSEALGEEIG